MEASFAKMHGLGNDFAVFDGVSQRIALDSDTVRRIADRRYGIGCDQVLIAEPAFDGQSDFFYRIFNADGNEAEQCGNGARCITQFVRARGFTSSDSIRFQTVTGFITTRMTDDFDVAVDMGEPQLEPWELPFLSKRKRDRYEIECGAETVSFAAVSMGNPHAVVEVENIGEAPVDTWGSCMQANERFPHGVNVGFMQILSPAHIALRVRERGAGETLACGSGACAAVVAGRMWEKLGASVAVDLKGGRLMIEWQGLGNSVTMTGPAETAFEGTIRL